MSATHFGKFYWSDHLSDPCLRACSAAARGVWMDMLCLMAEADGFLTVNDRPLDAAGLARQTGDPKEVIEAALGELEANGVFGRDRRGVIYSRRMVRDRKKVEIARQNGRKGGNPSLRKNSEIPGSDKPHHKQTPGIIQIPEAKIPEAHVRVSGSENGAASPQASQAARAPAVSDQAMEYREIEEAVRKAAGVEHDVQNFRLHDISPIKALVDQGYDLHREIVPAIRGKAATLRAAGQSITSWRYFDGPVRDYADRLRTGVLKPPPPPKKPPSEFTEGDWKSKLLVARNRKLWVRSAWGPAPNEPDCLVPPHLLRAGEQNMNWPEPLH